MNRFSLLFAGTVLGSALAGATLAEDAVRPVAAERLIVDAIDGTIPGDREVTTTLLNEDDIPEFVVDNGEQTRILMLQDGVWRDIAGTGIAAGVSDFALGDVLFNGMMEIVADGAVHAFAGGEYRPKQSIPPSPLDPGAYARPCATDPEILDQIAFYGADKGQAAPYCACLQKEIAARGLPQQLYDYLIPRKFDHSDRPDASDISDVDYDRVFAVQYEAELACDIAFGWREGFAIIAGETDYALPLPPGGGDFFQACTHQDWIVGNSRIGTAGRAALYCGCVAARLAGSGMNGEGFRLSGAFMVGDMSENELAAIDPGVIDAGDEASETCIRTLADSAYCPADRPHVMTPACVDQADAAQ